MRFGLFTQHDRLRRNLICSLAGVTCEFGFRIVEFVEALRQRLLDEILGSNVGLVTSNLEHLRYGASH